MTACCTFCKGTGREQDDNGVTFTRSRCTFCGGSGGWNEIDGNVTGVWGRHLTEAADRRRAGQQ